MNNVSQYRDIEIDTEVMTASPHRLIQMLVDKCLQQIQLAKMFILNKDIKQKHQVIAKANAIVDYLRLCLNVEDEKAQALSMQLSTLYTFLEKNLLYATLEHNIDYLDQAYLVLSNIKEGWDGIASHV